MQTTYIPCATFAPFAHTQNIISGPIATVQDVFILSCLLCLFSVRSLKPVNNLFDLTNTV